MSNYHEVLHIAENLTPDEQMRLIEQLSKLIRDSSYTDTITQAQHS